MKRSSKPLWIAPYGGFIGNGKIYLKGRVLRRWRFIKPKTSAWGILGNTLGRFASREVPHLPLTATFRKQQWKLITDREGYFQIDAELENFPATDYMGSWLDVQLEIGEDARPTPIQMAQVLLIDTKAHSGIISDIDDTLLETGVTSFLKWQVIQNTLLIGAEQRVAMEGMVRLLSFFGQRPIFYLSHSPWNLYDVIKEFLQKKNFAQGPILLRDYGLRPVGYYAEHKSISIDQILRFSAPLPFILLGDTAHNDADIYLEAARKYPGRILCIYIRETKNTKNARRVRNIMDGKPEVPFVLVHTAAEIESHARKHGFIS